MAGYRVDLDVFAGPLDLLLYLVRKDEVDIYDIPLARVTEQYVRYVEMLRMFDIDLAGDFLVMAATLMEIKSVMLLPKVEAEDGEDGSAMDPRSELVRQLLEYKKFKDAANLLGSSASERKMRYTRPDTVLAGLKHDAEPEVDLDEVGIWNLLEAFDKIMQATGQYADFSIIKDDTPIDLYQIEILHRLQSDGMLTFECIFEGRKSKAVMVGLLLATLELMKNQLVWLEQAEGSEQMYVKATTDVPAEQAVQDAIYRNEIEQEEAATSAKDVVVEGDSDEDVLEDFAGYEEDEDTLSIFEVDEGGGADLPIPIEELPAEKKSQRSPDEAVVDGGEVELL
ncbi:MAG: segregation/condensation protein A [Anaerohalosphaera sp.]|nr:segregation/condensation protein A [Anaerohalosphaera sp.]